jgi:hypothetical protein
MKSKNEVLCAAASRLDAERREADKPAIAHKTIFAPNIRYTIFSSNLHNKDALSGDNNFTDAPQRR